jgi:hypothetical protein
MQGMVTEEEEEVKALHSYRLWLNWTPRRSVSWHKWTPAALSSVRSVSAFAPLLRRSVARHKYRSAQPIASAPLCSVCAPGLPSGPPCHSPFPHPPPSFLSPSFRPAPPSAPCSARVQSGRVGRRWTSSAFHHLLSNPHHSVIVLDTTFTCRRYVGVVPGAHRHASYQKGR